MSSTKSASGISTGTLASRPMHQAQIDGLKFAAEQNVIATLSAGIVYLWDASTGRSR